MDATPCDSATAWKSGATARSSGRCAARGKRADGPGEDRTAAADRRIRRADHCVFRGKHFSGADRNASASGGRRAFLFCNETEGMLMSFGSEVEKVEKTVWLPFTLRLV